MNNTFKQFLDDETAYEMYITGAAGTGKTTGLAQLVQYCMDIKLEYVVCAFTHKACGVLRDKLPQEAKVQTLHSFLSKRPTINQNAQHRKHVQQNLKMGETDAVRVLFVDEYSMIGERDLMDIRAEEDLRVVWLGDPHQLPPVGDVQAVRPHGKYCVTLTKVYRQAANNPLMVPLQQLISYIEGSKPTPLVESSHFLRNQDIVNEYKKDRGDKILLAFTNERVQSLNADIAGKEKPEPGDRLFSPSTKHHYTMVRYVPLSEVDYIDKPFGDALLLGSKYKTLEHVLTKDYEFMEVEDDDGDIKVFATIFGHYDYKVEKEELTDIAAKANAAIPDDKPAQWAKQNKASTLARKRARAWRDFLSFDECVVCMDFAHAMTIHKSQGSTYDTVYLDTDDLAIVAAINYQQYLKLMYVAISRAAQKVYTT